MVVEESVATEQNKYQKQLNILDFLFFVTCAFQHFGRI